MTEPLSALSSEVTSLTVPACRQPGESGWPTVMASAELDELIVADAEDMPRAAAR
ncbi:hypothetical protein QTQ03_23415 [Micromonospora sp. WMMA1363]|uniref:hypothetical protein n=1 Tax=Micromonospora sp. WMMA1363 TaxID=3053985 RepID=UPI00259D2233|nr:hypothetical protein [Micromonospora sp. WMMA1363]MDM4722391.1 hypothetical protein [Micromonospora sp. WMMA1363]